MGTIIITQQQTVREKEQVIAHAIIKHDTPFSFKGTAEEALEITAFSHNLSIMEKIPPSLQKFISAIAMEYQIQLDLNRIAGAASAQVFNREDTDGKQDNEAVPTQEEKG